MSRSIKPTLILLALMCIPFLLLAGLYMYLNDLLTFKNVVIALVTVPVLVVILMLMGIAHPARYGVLSDKQRARDAAKYLDKEND